MSNTNNIHPSAVIEDSVILGKAISIGPFCHIKGNVKISDGCNIDSHVVISGNTEIGENNKIFPFAVIGSDPQDLKFSGEYAKVIIGNNNIIREHVTIHSGTADGNKSNKLEAVTKIGNNCLFMVGSHIAHDCYIGNNVILANNATLAGHVSVDDYVIVGGLSAVKQFIRIGKHAIIGGMSGVEKDVIPFGLVMGERANLAGLNLVGLKRRSFPIESIRKLQNMYQSLFKDSSGVFNDRVSDLKSKLDDENVASVIEFLESEFSNGICTPNK
ncbi:MAG: acyl-ACP--UDP-N-acetylglucosamine O-acyltransferase [Rickettsiales bacterium]|nr:acyl-ACP--UDP-N-acetylglucosamine O-acyltransferase [Rickettsiales bacterium]